MRGHSFNLGNLAVDHKGKHFILCTLWNFSSHWWWLCWLPSCVEKKLTTYCQNFPLTLIITMARYLPPTLANKFCISPLLTWIRKITEWLYRSTLFPYPIACSSSSAGLFLPRPVLPAPRCPKEACSGDACCAVQRQDSFNDNFCQLGIIYTQAFPIVYNNWSSSVGTTFTVKGRASMDMNEVMINLAC